MKIAVAAVIAVLASLLPLAFDPSEPPGAGSPATACRRVPATSTSQAWLKQEPPEESTLMLGGIPLWSAPCKPSLVPPLVVDAEMVFAVVGDYAPDQLRVVKLSPNAANDIDIIKQSEPGYGETPVTPASPVPVALFKTVDSLIVLWLSGTTAGKCLCDEIRYYTPQGLPALSVMIEHTTKRYEWFEPILRIPLPEHDVGILVDGVTETAEGRAQLWITTVRFKTGRQDTIKCSVPKTWWTLREALPLSMLKCLVIDEQSVRFDLGEGFVPSSVRIVQCHPSGPQQPKQEDSGVDAEPVDRLPK